MSHHTGRGSAPLRCTGYVDWHRLDRTLPRVRYVQGEHTYVYAFWPVDYGVSNHDHGVTLLKDEGRHPDWFLHAETADKVLAAYTQPHSLVSPNFNHIFDNNLAARPLLASALLGTVDGVYHSNHGMWWASPDDLTRRGKKILRDMNRLYERSCTLVTFVDGVTDEERGPRDLGI